MNGLEALKYLDEHNLNWHDNPTKKAVKIIENELKAFHILMNAFLKDERQRRELSEMKEEEFVDAYKHETGDLKDMFSEEEYVFCLKVMKGMVE